MSEDDRRVWDSVIARILRGKTMRAYMGWFLMAQACDRCDALLMQGIESARARECGETVDGKPLCSRSYVHSLMLASELFPNLAPSAFRVGG